MAGRVSESEVASRPREDEVCLPHAHKHPTVDCHRRGIATPRNQIWAGEMECAAAREKPGR